MSFKKAIISTAAAAALSTASMAATVEADGVGNYLVMPSYDATADYGNWSTDIRVVNTNTTNAVIAKVVIRAHEDSEELLDFPIYLSPGDVWVATLSQEVSGGPVLLKCSDDSMVIDGKVVGTDLNVSQELFKTTTTTIAKPGSHDGTRGYIEVLEVAKEDAAAIASANGHSWKERQPLSKLDMYNSYTDGNVSLGVFWRAHVTSGDIYGQTVTKADGTGAERGMTVMATAFDVSQDTNATVGTLDSDLNRVTIIGNDTRFSNTYKNLPDGDAEVAIEKALEKAGVYVTYYNNTGGETQLILNQPMKKYHIKSWGSGTQHIAYYDGNSSAGTNACFYQDNVVRDNMEHSYNAPDPDKPNFSGNIEVTPPLNPNKVCNEVQWIDVMKDNTEGYASGYVDYTFYNTYTKSAKTPHHEPVIPVVMTGVKIGGKPVVNMYYPSYK